MISFLREVRGKRALLNALHEVVQRYSRKAEMTDQACVANLIHLDRTRREEYSTCSTRGSKQCAER